MFNRDEMIEYLSTREYDCNSDSWVEQWKENNISESQGDLEEEYIYEPEKQEIIDLIEEDYEKLSDEELHGLICLHEGDENLSEKEFHISLNLLRSTDDDEEE